jgi:hypothetical protein
VKPKKRPLDPVRQALIVRGEFVRERIEASLQVLRDPKARVEDADGKWIDACFERHFAKEGSLWWLSFTRGIDHAARIAIKAPASYDAERARVARQRFAQGFYPDHAAKLDDAKVLAAVTAWRTQRHHWEAVRAALLDVGLPLPTARNMGRLWQNFPHSPHPHASKAGWQKRAGVESRNLLSQSTDRDTALTHHESRTQNRSRQRSPKPRD